MAGQIRKSNRRPRTSRLRLTPTRKISRRPGAAVRQDNRIASALIRARARNRGQPSLNPFITALQRGAEALSRSTTIQRKRRRRSVRRG